MTDSSGATPTASPARAVLVGGALPGGATGLIFGAVSLAAGGSAAASAWLGAALAAAALAVGPLIFMVVKSWPPPAVMLAALIGYATAVVIVGAVYAALAPRPWVRGGYAGYAVLATMIAWIVGQLRATARLRILAFGSGTQGDGGGDKTR